MYNHINCKRACCSEQTRQKIIKSLDYKRLPVEKKKCLSCGLFFERKRKNRGRGNTFCSKDCVYKYGGRKGIPLSESSRKKLSQKYKGAGSPSWKGGVSKDKNWVKERQKNIRRRKRKQVVDILGGKCVCCGESEYKFLAIDHINGGGRKEYLETRTHSFQNVINQKFPQGKYQILCHNCNFAKGFWGKCPHQLIEP